MNNLKFVTLLLFLFSYVTSYGASIPENNILFKDNFEYATQKDLTKTHRVIVPKKLDGNYRLDTKEKHKGSKSLFLTVNKANSLRYFTPKIKVSPGEKIEISAFIKLKNVKEGAKRYYKAGGYIYYYDTSGKKIAKREIGFVDGTRSWFKFHTKITVPEKVASLTVWFGILKATGTMWIDEVVVKRPDTPPKTNLISHASISPGQYYIFPTPVYRKNLSGFTKWTKKIAIMGNIDPKLYFLKNAKKAFPESFTSNGQNLEPGTFKLIVTKKDTILGACKEKKEAQKAYQHKQGYIISIDGDKTILCARTDQGLLYALQTLKQLAVRDKNKGLRFKKLFIADYPSMLKRGNVFGSLMLRMKKKGYNIPEYLDSKLDYKINYVFMTGSYLDGIAGFRRKDKMTNAEKQIIRNFIAESKKRYMIPVFGISPSMPNGIRFSMKNKPIPVIKQFDYNNEDCYQSVFRKLDDLYDAGVRNFSINFDDLRYFSANRLHREAETKRFRHIGNAHVHLVKRMYDYLKKKDSKVTVRMVPLAYTNPVLGDKKFLKIIKATKTLPQDIMIFSTGINNQQSKRFFRELTGRDSIRWCNARGHALGVLRPSALLPPYPGANQDLLPYYLDKEYFILYSPYIYNKKQNKYFFEPHNLYMHSAADFLWHPESYNPAITYAKAIATIIPNNLAVATKQYDKIKKEMFGKDMIPCFKVKCYKQNKRIQYCKRQIAILTNTKKKLANLKVSKEFKSVKSGLLAEVDFYIHCWNIVVKENIQRNFPIIVPKVNMGDVKVQWPVSKLKKCSLINDFVLIKKHQKQTILTDVYLAWHDNALLLKVVCNEPFLNKQKIKHKKRDSTVFADDCIEIFIAKTKSLNYYHMAINAAGALFDEKVVSGAIEYDKPEEYIRKPWNSKNIKTASFKTRNSWVLQIKIPASEFGIKKIKKGMRWNFNICRARYTEKMQFSSYAYLFKSFHEPDRFFPIDFK
jgi:beta-N-acetylglucosaminidase/Glycosyl hydrolase family 20, domain 2/Carbohydrate-binding family 9